MKFIRDIHAARRGSRPVISFEFFPPKSLEGERVFLQKTLPALAKLKPDFCSVTYGTGGSSGAQTLMITDRIQREFGLAALHHLTCVNATQVQIAAILDLAARLNVHNILALRGDPPPGRAEFAKPEGGFEFASELVAFIKKRGGFSVGAAGFPEGHPACKEGKFADWENLKRKVEAGADFVLTQLFFDNANFFEFHEHLTRKLGVSVPLCPGIMPLISQSQIKHIHQLCPARWPEALLARLDALNGNDEAIAELGIEYATRQCEGLLKYGVSGLHFYTMNKLRSTREILKNLKLAQ
jgi:methylenetetrahydrofolate reductase (NADPH)